jgi:hypothetical protein
MAEPKQFDLKTATNATGEVDTLTQHSTSTPRRDPEEHEGVVAGASMYVDNEGLEHYTAPVETSEELVTEVLHVEDDPTLNPWTFRTWFLGMRPMQIHGKNLMGMFRDRFSHIRRRVGHHIPIQAADYSGFNDILSRHQLCLWRVHGIHLSPGRTAWKAS